MPVQALAIGEDRFDFHRFERMRGPIESALSADDVAVETTTDRDVLRDLSAYDALVDYLTDSTLADGQRDGLLSFVRGGGGYVGVHCAADLTTAAGENREEPVPGLEDLIGGHFVAHPEQSAFDVTVVDSHHPVTAGLDGFTVWDEPYQLEYDDVRVLARMDHPELGDMPVAWVKPYGDGRVFYCSLGHDRPAFASEGVRSLLRRGVRWAGGA